MPLKSLVQEDPPPSPGPTLEVPITFQGGSVDISWNHTIRMEQQKWGGGEVGRVTEGLEAEGAFLDL